MNIFKRTSALNMLLLLALQLMAQGSNGTGTYYQSADGKKGSALKTAMSKIIVDHETLNYGKLWDAYYDTDRREDGSVWDMYSSTTHFKFGQNQCGNYSDEGDCYNREHSMPKSWFNDASPMDDFSKLGPSSVSGYSGTVFEPNDEYKGDFARIYFYMVTCYEDRISSWDSDMLSGNKYPAFTTWALNMLLRWAAEDPVSQKEIDRNNAVYKWQGNRNPYVDYPGLEQYVWGDKQDVAFSYDNYSTGITIIVPTKEISDVDVYTITGVKVRSNVSKDKATDGLDKGIYIVGDKKYVVK